MRITLYVQGANGRHGAITRVDVKRAATITVSGPRWVSSIASTWASY
jgi:hypothetical protein